MKSLASVSLSLLLLATISVPYAYAQDDIPPLDQPQVEASADTAAQDDDSIPALDDGADVSIDDIIAGAVAGDDAPEEEVAPVTEEKKDDAPEAVAEKVEEPAKEEAKPVTVGEVEEPASDDLKSEAEILEAPAEEEETALEGVFEGLDDPELTEKMPAEVKELEVPGEAKGADDTKTVGRIISAGEPEEVTVSVVPAPYVDIYARQIKYKTTAEKLRASLEARREAFEGAHFEALTAHRGNVAEMYEGDSEAYRKREAEKDAARGGGTKKKVARGTSLEDYLEQKRRERDEIREKLGEKRGSKPKATAEGEKVASAGAAADDSAAKAPEEEVGVQVADVGVEKDDDGQEIKKRVVVMPEDAPEFDTGLIE